MPTNRKQKRSASAKSSKGRSAKSKRSATKGLKKRVSRAAAPVKRTAKKVLAGAAAGAMLALVPEVQKVANSMGGGSKPRGSREGKQ